ncbi:MAG: pyridoxamine 5'-phosphate oxidase family protein [Solobacterium sp.]|nr:pyridoxamine 5'-phosphate oxidase family protein [Solobacterium sp.]
MFQELKRKKQALTNDQCISILKSTKRGVLSIYGLEGYPYGMPLNPYYEEESGKLYFHSGKFGHKIDALKENPRASFCVYDEGYRKDGEWALNISSVIVFGEVQLIEEKSKVEDICRKLSYQFTDDEAYIEGEIEKSLSATVLLEFTIHNICGKIVNEA